MNSKKRTHLTAFGLSLSALILLSSWMLTGNNRENDSNEVVSRISSKNAIQSETYRSRSDSNCTDTYSAEVSKSGATVTFDTEKVTYQTGDSSLRVVVGLTVTVSGSVASYTIPISGTWWKIPFDPDEEPTIMASGNDVFTCICMDGGGICNPVAESRGGTTITHCVPQGPTPCMPCSCVGADVQTTPYYVVEAAAVIFNGDTYN
jgi:hypothetical protein